MSNQTYTPRAGVDAMTRDGRRVEVESDGLLIWAKPVDGSSGWNVSAESGRRNFITGPDNHGDLVRDADPQPDAYGWIDWTPGPWTGDPDTLVQVDISGAITNPEGRPASFWMGRGEGVMNDWWSRGLIKRYRIVSPAPQPAESGPVKILSARQRAALALTHSIISGEPLANEYCRPLLDWMAELEQRAKGAIGKAMKEGGE